MAKEDIAKTKTPQKGEKTKSQGIAGFAGILSNITGFNPALMGTYKVYRKMRKNPTVALARAISTAPVRMASWSVTADDEVTNADEITKFIKKEMEIHWRSLIKNILYALDYGWSPFEKVWKVNDEGKWVYRKLKPLLVDKTKILVNRETGVFEGFQNMSAKLGPENSFLYSYDVEAGYLYGRSRHENIRTSAYRAWEGAVESYGKYINKIAGIIPIVEYPEGISNTEGGKEIDNYDIAKGVLQHLGTGHGVTMPNVLISWAEDAVKSGVDISKLKAWTIQFLETKGQHGTQFVNSFKHIESLLLRGWLVLERGAVEGTHGTKAEAKVHGDLTMQIAELLFEEILEFVNWYLVNPLLIYNFGLDYENKVRLERAGPDPETKKLLTAIFTKVLSEGANSDLLAKWVDIDTAFDALGIPKAEETLDTDLEERNSMEKDAEDKFKDVKDKMKKVVNGPDKDE
jgi:hypothetical protein